MQVVGVSLVSGKLYLLTQFGLSTFIFKAKMSFIQHTQITHAHIHNLHLQTHSLFSSISMHYVMEHVVRGCMGPTNLISHCGKKAYQEWVE